MTKHYWERQQQIDHLFKIVDKVQSDENIDSEIKSCLAKYLCVVVSGFLETSIQDIYMDYAQRNAQTNVANFTSKKLTGFHSAKMGNILALSGGFCQNWRTELELITKDEIGDSITSLVDNRHHIAHGKDVGITYSRIKSYYSNSVKLLKLIEKQCNK